jgi:hypothetical protein
MSARWFRFYDEVLDDPKVQKLSGDDFKAWVNILCLASRNDGKLPSQDDIAFSLRCNVSCVSTLIERLLNRGLIDKCNGGPNGYHYAPHGWSKRQYKSDTSTDRVKRFRERTKRSDETAPEAETDKNNKKKHAHELPENWRPSDFGEKTKSRSVINSWTPERLEHELERFSAHHAKIGTKFVDWQAAWGTWVLNSKDFERNNNGGSRAPIAKLGTTSSAAARLRERFAAQAVGQDELFGTACVDGQRLALPAK